MRAHPHGRSVVVLACFALACGSGTDGGDGNEAGASPGGMSAGGAPAGGTSSGKGGTAGTGGTPSQAGTTNSGGTNPTGGSATGGNATGGNATGGNAAGGLAGLGGGGRGGAGSGAGGMDSSGAGGVMSGSGGASSGAGGALGGSGGKGFGGAGNGGANNGGKGAGGAGGMNMSGGGGAGTGGNPGGSGGTNSSNCPADGNVTYTLMREANPTGDQQEAYELITEAMDTAIRYYNCYTNITKATTVQYNPSVQTADGNSNGNIRFGGKQYMEYSRAMHEIAHTVGIGTYQEFHDLVEDGIFVGEAATAQVRENTGNPSEEVHADSQHFWPGGLNYASEAESEQDLIDHCLMVAAIRQDMGFDP
jgi:hypothetical protein